METRFREIVRAALDVDDDDLAAYLATACGTDAELLQRVRAKLVSLKPDDDFLVPPDPLPVRLPELADFELLAEIGRGGSGIVYRARQKSLGREVAIKLLSYELASEKTGVERFHREARIMAQIRHPAIAQVHTSGRSEEHHYIAMELVHGHDLETELELRRGKELGGVVAFLPTSSTDEYQRSCAQIIAVIADGLEQAHKQRIVHRDVKPRNVLLQPDGAAKLVDFGMARDDNVSRMTRSNVLAGTLCYMSPEQTQAGRVPVDHRTDVYSLGVVLYELLTLTRPFDGPTPVAILRAIESHDPRPLESMDPPVDAALSLICATAMHRDVERRYRSAAALATELRRYLDDRPIRAKPDSRAHVAWERLARHRNAIASAAVVGAMMSAAILSLMYMWHRAELGHLDLRITARGYERARIAVRTKDPRTDAAGEHRDFGERTTLQVGLPVGYYRIHVSAPGKATLELARYLERGEVTEIEIKDTSNHARSINIEADTLTIADSHGLRCPLTGLTVSVPGFEIDSHAVTNRAFREFCARTGWPEPELLKAIAPGSPGDLKPVTSVSFADAQAYAEWRGRRLPTYGEWLLATRDQAKRVAKGGRPLTIDAEEEWTESLSCIEKRDATGNHWKSDPARRLVVGGHWATAQNPKSTLRMSREGTEPTATAPTRGFRCARSVP